ncbi:MAG: hypothetical protein M1491_05910 [Deltaproteobacteria bacterium]|nr:hypothetical protein [Deltaproteobacteria bacterium]MCL5278067.1 hypothetical protein [Deltaproteobacteria bacterium]
MKYVLWGAGVTASAFLQVVLNDYMPAYLAPNLFLMLTMYMTFYYGYYATLSGIVFISYVSSVFSSGSIWFYVFSYTSVFYLLSFFKKFFDRKQPPTIVVLSLLTTLIYPLFVFFPSVFSGKIALFQNAFRLSFMQVFVNIAAAYLIFRYVPRMDRRFAASARTVL